MKLWLYKACSKGANLYYRFFYKLNVVGLENIKANQNYCICGNHMNWRDPFAMGAGIPLVMQFMGKHELFKNKIVAWFLSSIGVFPVDRDNNDLRAIKNALRILKEGGNLALFPEGTRNKTKEPLPVKPGIVLMALKTKTPILPVTIDGSFKKFKPVNLYIHPPVSLEAYYDQKLSQEEMENIANQIMLTIYEQKKYFIESTS